eukprot:7144935-Pyramimonas_sp.AAC.1
MGAEVNLDGLRRYVVGHGNVLVHNAFDTYHRQLATWWPETLFTRYTELPRGRGADDAWRQWLARYLLNPSSASFAQVSRQLSSRQTCCKYVETTPNAADLGTARARGDVGQALKPARRAKPSARRGSARPSTR